MCGVGSGHVICNTCMYDVVPDIRSVVEDLVTLVYLDQCRPLYRDGVLCVLVVRTRTHHIVSVT